MIWNTLGFVPSSPRVSQGAGFDFVTSREREQQRLLRPSSRPNHINNSSGSHRHHQPWDVDRRYFQDSRRGRPLRMVRGSLYLWLSKLCGTACNLLATYVVPIMQELIRTVISLDSMPQACQGERLCGRNRTNITANTSVVVEVDNGMQTKMQFGDVAEAVQLSHLFQLELRPRRSTVLQPLMLPHDLTSKITRQRSTVFESPIP